MTDRYEVKVPDQTRRDELDAIVSHECRLGSPSGPPVKRRYSLMTTPKTEAQRGGKGGCGCSYCRKGK